MPQHCTVCAHPERDRIDVELAGGGSARALAPRVGLSQAALLRHRRRHLSPALVRVAREHRTEESARGSYLSVLDRLETLAVRIDRFIDTAEHKGSIVGGAAVLREMRSTLETIARITGELDERGQSVTVNVLASPEVAELVRRLLGALAPFPEARIAAAAALDVVDVEEAVAS